jgi:hypothetical protein
MAEHKTIKSLACEVIEECLIAAGMCVKARKPDGGILGYPATLLLLAVTDAIGHGLDVGSGNTRLRVLKHPPFRELLAKSGQKLSCKHVDNLTQWYRHVLAHRGLIAPGVALTPETEGPPFGFTGNELCFIRVPAFRQLLQDAWVESKDEFAPRFQPRDEEGWPKSPALLGVMSAVSGITEADIMAAITGESKPPTLADVATAPKKSTEQTPQAPGSQDCTHDREKV